MIFFKYIVHLKSNKNKLKKKKRIPWEISKTHTHKCIPKVWFNISEKRRKLKLAEQLIPFLRERFLHDRNVCLLVKIANFCLLALQKPIEESVFFMESFVI